MDNFEHMADLLEGVTVEELLRSYDAEFLDECRLYYEELEAYEVCAVLRDRIKELTNDNPKLLEIRK